MNTGDFLLVTQTTYLWEYFIVHSPVGRPHNQRKCIGSFRPGTRVTVVGMPGDLLLDDSVLNRGLYRKVLTPSSVGWIHVNALMGVQKRNGACYGEHHE